MSPSTVPLARLTTLSLMFVLPLMALPAQGAQTYTPPGGMMIASGHSNSNAHQHGAGGRAHARRPGLHAHVTTTDTINPAISLTPSAGPGGSSIAVSGRGFVPYGTITLSVDGSPVSTDCKADASGSFSTCAFTVPAETGGTHTVTATDHIANSAAAIYTASAFARSTISTSATASAVATNTGNPSISLSSSAGKVGSSIAVSGSGFAAYGTITVTFDGSSVSTDCKSKANGSFRYCVLTITASIAGTHTVTASDGNANSASAMYTVNPAISLTPRTGVAGSSAAVSGSGYAPYRPITLTFDGSSVATDCITNANGSFRYCTFTVPAAPAGPHAVTASDSRTNVASVRFFHSASASFTVNPAISLNAAAGAVGSTVTLSGSNFKASSSLTVTFDGTPLSTSGTCTADDKGNLPASNNCAFTVPTATAGFYTVTASDGTNSGTATFTVNPAISLTSSTGAGGSRAAVSGSGFASFATITVSFDGGGVATDCSTDATGSFRYCALTVPAAPAGPHTVTASDTSANAASAMYTVTPAISLAPSAGVVGSTAAVSGSGFKANATITVSFDSSSVATSCTTNANGSFSACPFTVPAAPAGPHTVTASDTSANAAAARFTATPVISLNPAAGVVGSAVTLSGSNVKASSSLTVTFDGTPLSTSGTCTADDKGNLPASNNCAFTVPTAPAGPHTVTASDGTDSGSATFAVNSAISLTPSASPVGSGAAINGSGFAPYSTLAVTFDGKSVATECTTDAMGSFSACPFTVPAAPAGPHTVTASNGSENSASVSFTVTPVISLTPSAGAGGSAVTLSGRNFKPGSSITVMFDGTKLSTCTADDSGNLPTKNACAFTVPAATAGIYTVTASDTSANSAAARLTVIPAIILTASAGAGGSRAAVSGSGFAPFGTITVTFDGSSVATSCTTDATGSFGSCAFTVPAAAAGPHTVRATDSSGDFAWVRFIA